MIMPEDAGIKDQPSPTGLSFFSVKALLVALAFGLAALAVVVAALTIPIRGTNVVTDPRRFLPPPGPP